MKWLLFLSLLFLACQPGDRIVIEPKDVPKTVVQKCSEPVRPEHPELDYAGECIWLTNHVLGKPRLNDDPPASQLKFLKDCAKDEGDWRQCREYSKHVWGNNDQARSDFFYECLEKISRSIEASCCYDAWDCRQSLHYTEHNMEEISEKCYDYCEKLPGNHPCYTTCN